MNSNYHVSSDVEGIDVPQLMQLFASAWWTAERTETETRGVVTGSDVVVTVVNRVTGRLVGFARVLTDKTCLAMVLDVLVAPDVRGSGIGSLLMNAVLGHPWVTDVKSIELVCQPDLVDFYRRWQFTDQVGKSRLMRRTVDPLLIADA